MTPKEKAFQLFCKFYRDNDLLVENLSRIQAKECALIAVNEIMQESMSHTEDGIYWNEVKQEINNL